MSAAPSEDAPRLRTAMMSPLLGDADWINSFRWMVGELLNAGRAVIRHGSMSSYRLAIIETKWKPWLKGLACHVYRVVEDGRNSPLDRSYTCDPRIEEAYQLACAAFDEAAAEAGPNAAMMAALEDIAERLAHWQALATAPAGKPAVADTPPPEEPAAAGDAPGSKALGSRAGRQARKVPRGELDEQAVAMLLKNPTLTFDQLAEALGCRPGTLRDKAKCPRLAQARASIEAQREAFRGGSTWQDRRRDGDEA